MKEVVPLKVNYLCPECRSYLRVWNNIIFTVKSLENNKQGLLLLNPGLGNYTAISHQDLILKKGENIEFFCPVCHTNLTASEISNKLVKIIMIDENNKEYDVYFSKITRELATFKIDKDNVIVKYGEDTASYMNYFTVKLKKQLGKIID